MKRGSSGLSAALGLSRPTVVSLIGGGGKTTLLYRLGRELVAEGYAVLLTTTTHMFYPAPGEADEVLLAPGASLVGRPEILVEKVRPGRRLFLARSKEGQKMAGFDPAEVDRLATAFPGAFLLVEADGAARRPCKGYAPHEPAVPPSTGLLVAMAGLDALEKPLSEEWVHRPQMVAAVTGLCLGDRLPPEALALALAEGLRRGRRAQRKGRAVAWLNKVIPERLHGGRRVARHLLQLAALEKVIIGATAGEEAVWEVWPGAGGGPLEMAGVILAAGTSSRLSAHKLLLPLGGKSILEQVADVALASPLAPVVAVLGHRAREVAAVLGGRPVVKAYNPDYALGQSTSVRTSLAVLPQITRAALFLLGDQPLVGPAVIEALVAAYLKTGARVVYPTYEGRRGNPVLFDRDTFAALAGLQGDQGGRGLLAELQGSCVAVPVADPGILLDIDTPADYELAKELWESRRG